MATMAILKEPLLNTHFDDNRKYAGTLFIRRGAEIIKRAIRDRDVSFRSANTPRIKRFFSALTFLARLARIQLPV